MTIRLEPDDGYVLHVDLQRGDPGPIEPLGRYRTLAVSLPAVGDWIDTGNAGYQVVSRVWELGDDEVCCRLIVIGGGA